MNNKCGVYKIQNKIDGKLYIGSSKDIERRKKEHLCRLRQNNHDNQYLQNAYNKYGKENFIFEIIELCDTENQYDLEQKWINLYKDKNILYNISLNAIEPPHTAESIKKMSITNKGRVPWNKGKTNVYTQETKNKISNSLKGRYIGGKNPFSKMVVRIIDSKIYNSFKECMLDNNISHSTLYCHTINSRINMPQMYMLYDEYKKTTTKELKKIKKKILEYKRGPINKRHVVRLSDNKIYESMKECAEDNNISPSLVSQHYRGFKKVPKFAYYIS